MTSRVAYVRRAIEEELNILGGFDACDGSHIHRLAVAALRAVDNLPPGVTSENAEPLRLKCGCLANRADAHRVGCPDNPEGVRGA